MFDVVVEKNFVKIIDFNVFGKKTDALLFCWEELFLLHLALENNTINLEEFVFDFRVIEQPIHIQPTLSAFFGKPLDNIDVTSFDGMLELVRLQKRQEKECQQE